jgi:hypothetical protein
MLECVIFAVLFNYNKVVQKWFYNHLTYELVTLLTSSFRALLLVWTGLLAYIIARVSDGCSHARLIEMRMLLKWFPCKWLVVRTLNILQSLKEKVC